MSVPAPVASLPGRPRELGAWIWRGLLSGVVLAAYAGAWRVPFVFDDIPAVLANPTLHTLGGAWFPPPDLSVSGRPLANFTLGLNFAIGGTAVAGYHALNLGLHLAACWLVFGMLRRAAPRCGLAADADAFAGVVAALWALHPVATGAVTYVMQRTELLVSGGALLAVYSSVRAIEAERYALPTTRWRILAVSSCAAAMLAKEVAVVIPLLIGLTDRLLDGTPSLQSQLRRRGAYYGALASTWLLQGTMLAFSAGRGASAGAGSGVGACDYAISQLAALTTYLRLFAWPYPLIFDRGKALIPWGPGPAAGVLLLLLILAAIAWSWRTRPQIATALSWFLLLLAPSSSVVPIATQIVAEHRVYLALLGPIVLVSALTLRLVGSRSFVVVAAGVVCALALLTLARNQDYQTLESLWADTACKAPTNARAHFNHGLALELAGRAEAARVAYTKCIDLDAHYREAHVHLARIEQGLGQHAAARAHFVAALAIQPDADLHNAAAVSLLLLNDPVEAVRHFEASLQLRANQPLVHYNLGLALQGLRRFEDALRHLEQAVQLNPADQEASNAAARLREFVRP